MHQRHILHYVIALAGLWPLWRGRAEFKGSGADLRLLGAVLLGFSLWWFVDIVLFHWVLAIHRIRVGVANPLAYDLGWLAVFGATTLLAGLWLRSRSTTDGVRSWLHVSALPQYGSVSIIQCPAVSRKPLEEGHRQFQKGLN